MVLGCADEDRCHEIIICTFGICNIFVGVSKQTRALKSLGFASGHHREGLEQQVLGPSFYSSPTCCIHNNILYGGGVVLFPGGFTAYRVVGGEFYYTLHSLMAIIM